LKRLLKLAVMAVLFVCSFAVAAWFLAPWESAGIYAMNFIRLRAAEKGVYLMYQNIEKSGYLLPSFSLSGFEAENDSARLSLSDVRIKLLPVSSLLALGGSCFIEFDGGGIDAPLVGKLNLEDGVIRLTATDDMLIASNVRVRGDIGVTGDIVYNTSSGYIVGSTLTLKVPDFIDSLLPMAPQPYQSYIESINPGEWRIKKNESPNG
jgi:hypothetical protein